jgi:methionyl-tRNA formyltransferase
MKIGSSKKVLFLGKVDDPVTAEAAAQCLALFPKTDQFLGRWGEPLPNEVRDWQGDIVLSFLSRWIVPSAVLKRAKDVAINFHPGPPEYPGIGCNNFAIYDEVTTYGATCHHMSPEVDSGAIIEVRRVSVSREETVESLLVKTYKAQLELFSSVLNSLHNGRLLPVSTERWSSARRTRADLDELARISPEMSETEVRRRIRATSFGPWQPTLELHGFRFRYEP